jgi:hypothetical protein
MVMLKRVMLVSIYSTLPRSDKGWSSCNVNAISTWVVDVLYLLPTHGTLMLILEPVEETFQMEFVSAYECPGGEEFLEHIKAVCTSWQMEQISSNIKVVLYLSLCFEEVIILLQSADGGLQIAE